MKLTELQTRLDEFDGKIAPADSGAPSMDIEDMRRGVAELERALLQKEKDLASLREQRERENKLKASIVKLENRISAVRDGAKQYEDEGLGRDAHAVYVEAVRLSEALEELKKQLLDARKAGIGRLETDAAALGEKTGQLESKFADLVKLADEKDREAHIEDGYTPEMRAVLLKLRAADFFLSKGLHEHDSLIARGKHFERTQEILNALPSEPEALRSIAAGMQKTEISKYLQRVREMKAALRARLGDLRSLISEGIDNKDITGVEDLPLTYALAKRRRNGDNQGFYARLWALNLLLLSDPNANPRLTTKVRSLLGVINDATANGDPEVLKNRRFAAEARRFLLLAGRGVIRRFLEEQHNGLKTEEDYVSLGKALHTNRYRLLQLAVNLPRLFDLSLTTRFERLYQRRTRRKTVHRVTIYQQMAQTDDLEDLPDIPPDQLDDMFPMRYCEGALAVRQFEERRVEQREVGREQHMEAQEYLLDVSPSMYPGYGSGNRWLVRNAIMLAALNSFSVDATIHGAREFPNLLFFRLFGMSVDELHAVASQDQAFLILKRFLTLQEQINGTNIQQALLKAFEDIKGAAGRHRSLRDAKVVLVTDGESSMHLPTLQTAQQDQDTAIVVHVFAVEKPNSDLKKLSQSSGPGRAFYYDIPSDACQRYAALPPYGRAEEFSPVYEEPEFGSEEEKQQFESTVSRMCDEIDTIGRELRKTESRSEETEGEALRTILHSLQTSRAVPRYEEDRIGRPDDRRTRKSRRVQDILTTMETVTDRYSADGEAMTMLRHMSRERAILPRELIEIFKRTGIPELQRTIVKYRTDVWPKLETSRKRAV